MEYTSLNPSPKSIALKAFIVNELNKKAIILNGSTLSELFSFPYSDIGKVITNEAKADILFNYLKAFVKEKEQEFEQLVS